MTNLINNRYQDICKELGHLRANQNKIEKRIAEIEAEMAALDSLSVLAKQEEQKKVMEQKLSMMKSEEQSRGTEQS
jgi:hypothetical protein